jgi:pimeloyl-ACP methyl ester carboxylesterase
MRAIFLSILYFFILLKGIAQEKIGFFASDNLKITADLYLKDKNLPFIILCHQANSSRGEYSEIANRLLKLNYNCLAVDLRAGDNINYIKNETAERAINNNIPHSFLDAKKDIEASIQYLKKYTHKPIILFGSSYSASLCLLIAKNNLNVQAVIAFSPGEYFRPELVVKDAIAGLDVPVFASATTIEYNYVIQLLSGINENLKTIYTPASGSGLHGAKELWQTSETSDQCWLQLLLFFQKFKTQ